MKYYMKQKVFSWRDRFTIKDEHGKDVYFVEGELFSWGKKLNMIDTSGKPILYIKQNIWNWLPNYTLYMHDQEVATVKKELTFLKPRYSIHGPNWDVEGNFWEHDYQIRENGSLIATISKEWFTWGDSYELDIEDDTHTLLALGIIVTIDCVIAAQAAASSS